MKIDKHQWPVLIISGQIGQDNDAGHRLDQLMEELRDAQECSTLKSFSYEDGIEIFRSRSDLGAVVVDWNIPEEHTSEKMTAEEFIHSANKRNPDIPLLLLTDRTWANQVPTDSLKKASGFLWILSDTIQFLAGRVEMHVMSYLQKLHPAFLSKLIKYAQQYKYAWHTPGHMGGEGFLRSPAGEALYKFFGENVFRADLSISVPELGSLLDHNGPVGDSEKFAARTFGADQTYYVLNGTSNCNQIIWHSQVLRDDIAFVDRNCHKSLNYAMVITEAYPIYMVPRRNRLGIIGPVRLSEFTKKSIQNKVHSLSLIPGRLKNARPVMSALTNSTYDGICYNVAMIKNELMQNVENLHFDEAWYAYARFHPMYKHRFGMTDQEMHKDHPPVFVSQSTHKLLTAFSQSSMLHIKNGGSKNIVPDEFNESYMMHGSTSPQYSMIASLDVATKMMSDQGEQLMHDIIFEAIQLRKKVVSIRKEYIAQDPNAWFFDMWQPQKVIIDNRSVDFEDADTEFLATDPGAWVMSKDHNWHGFEDIEDNYAMLDPIKLTFTTPGIDANGQMQERGIPAVVVTNFLTQQGIVCEKSDHYSWLMLNSLGTTRGKQGTLLSELLHFKDLYDANRPLRDIFPDLVKNYPDNYSAKGLKDHCQDMHIYIKEHNILEKMQEAFQIIPEQAMKPANAYHHVVKNNVEYVELANMMGRIPAVMIVPYPPGIPVMMGGEIMNNRSRSIHEYLQLRQDFENSFPGYESDIHGVERNRRNGFKYFKTLCIK